MDPHLTLCHTTTMKLNSFHKKKESNVTRKTGVEGWKKYIKEVKHESIKMLNGKKTTLGGQTCLICNQITYQQNTHKSASYSLQLMENIISGFKRLPVLFSFPHLDCIG